jgi:aquaporin Z
MGDSNATNKYVCEFLGTFVLVLIVTYNVATNASGVFGVTSIAFALMVMIYSIGHISGGHFNPAVSFAFALQGLLSYQDCVMYIVSQCAGGAVAGLCSGFIIDTKRQLLQPRTGTLLNVCVVEYLFTWMLCFVVLNVAASKKIGGQNQFYGLAIGLSVVAGGYAAGEVSGGVLNPAVTLGLAVSHFSAFILELPVYVVVQLAAGFGSVVSFHIVRPEEKTDDANANAITKVANKIEGLFPPKMAAEFVGTFMLSFCVGLNVHSRSPAGVWSIAACLACMIYAVGDISGGHFNPAVSSAVLVAGRDSNFNGKAFGEHVLSQLAGGAGGALGYMLVLIGVNGSDGTFDVVAKSGYTQTQGFMSEFFATFILAYVVLCVATTGNRLPEFVGFVIGACIVVGGSAMGNVTGGLMNPAVTIGADVVSLNVFAKPAACIVFVLAQFIGGCLAAVVFQNVTHASEYQANAKETTDDTSCYIRVA